MGARKNEWMEGRKVRLLRDMETRGGTKFPKGIVCLVTHVYLGQLSLEARNPDPNNIFGPKHIFIRAVRYCPWDMEVLPDDRPRCPWGCKHLSKAHDEKTEGCAEKRCECRWFPGTMEVNPEVEAAHDADEAFDDYDRKGRKDDKPTAAEQTHPDDLPEDERPKPLTCDCGKAELEQEAEVRLEPYAKLVKVSGAPTAIKHAAAGCIKVDYLGAAMVRLKSKSR